MGTSAEKLLPRSISALSLEARASQRRRRARDGLIAGGLLSHPSRHEGTAREALELACTLGKRRMTTVSGERDRPVEVSGVVQAYLEA